MQNCKRMNHFAVLSAFEWKFVYCSNMKNRNKRHSDEKPVSSMNLTICFCLSSVRVFLSRHKRTKCGARRCRIVLELLFQCVDLKKNRWMQMMSTVNHTDNDSHLQSPSETENDVIRKFDGLSSVRNALSPLSTTSNIVDVTCLAFVRLIHDEK